MTHATCPICRAPYCPVVDGRVWCLECEWRRQQARRSGVDAYCRAVRFVFRKQVDKIVGAG